MQRIATTLLAASMAAFASAQTITVPAVCAGVEGSSSTAYPWGRGSQQIRVQYVYDSTNFTTQSVNMPIIITQLSWRANTATVTAGYTYGNASVQMSAAAVDYLTPSTTFASNHGPSLATVYSGPVTVNTPAGTTPNSWYVTVPTAPFYYDPSAGADLCVDVIHDGIGPTTTAGPANDCATTTGLTSRIYNLTNAQSPTGSTQANVGVTLELTYAPASGLYPNFSGTPRTGPSGTIVQFTDQSYSSAPGGILTWSWDFNGDAIVDSNLQNPSFQYNIGGIYNVSLTVTDGQFGSQAITKNGYIGIDLADANFTTSIAGLTVQFTDTSTGNPTTWAWDFDNDGIVDSNLQNPTHVYPAAGSYNCKLTASNAYSSDSLTVNLGLGIIPQPAFGSTYTNPAQTRGFWFQAPTRFSITSLQVPDESLHGLQNAAVYRLAAPPTASTTGGLEFLTIGQPSNQQIPCAISFDAGEYVAVLGACGDSTTMRNSYGTTTGVTYPYASSVLGQPTSLTRLIAQSNLVVTNGTGAYQTSSGTLARVICGVSSAVGLQYGAGSPSPYAVAPTLKTTALPILGQNAVMTYTSADASVIGLMAAGFGRTSLPTPLGTLLVNGIVFTDVISGGAPLAAGSHTYSFAVPNNPALQGFSLNWQGASLVLPTGEFALSNATEWWLGL